MSDILKPIRNSLPNRINRRQMIAGGAALAGVAATQFPSVAQSATPQTTSTSRSPSRANMKVVQMFAPRQPLAVTQIPVPTPGKNDAIVRIEASGICRSDWHWWNGDWTWMATLNLPKVPGHEIGGVVEEVGSQIKNVRVGDRVTVPFHQADGTCPLCQQGKQNLCLNAQFPGVNHDGGWARYTRVTNADVNCIKLPNSIDNLTAAALGCRYMTAFHAVTAQGRVQPGQWVAIHGCGGVGLSAVQIASAMDALVVAVDIDDAKLQKAKQEGAIATVNSRTTKDVPAAIQELTGGGAHISIDALGREATVLNSVRSLRKAGRHVQVGLTTQAEKGMVAIPIDTLVNMEWEFVGSLGNPHPRYAELFALVERGKLNPRSLVTRQVALEDVNGILQQMTDYKTVGFNVITKF